MREYRGQFTSPYGAVDWQHYNDTFRQCVELSEKDYSQNLRELVTLCSVAPDAKQTSVAREEPPPHPPAAPADTQSEERPSVSTEAPAEPEPDPAVAKRILAKHKEEDAREAREEARWMAAVLSYRIAAAEADRREAIDEIAKEKKYSRYGGVISKTALYEGQQKIRSADEEIERVRSLAKDIRAKLVPRTAKTVAEVETCVENSEDARDHCRLIRDLFRQTEPEE